MAAARGRRKGGAIASVVWFVIIASLIVAFFQIPTERSTAGFGDVLVAKSQVMKSWITDQASKIDLSRIPTKIFS